MSLDPIKQIVSTYTEVSHGCDPELFFAHEGNVVGAEKIIPEEGLKSGYVTSSVGMSYDEGDEPETNIVLDGVQVELNPKPYMCRAHLGNEIASCFRTLRDHLKVMNGVKISFSSVVEVTQQELDSLSDKSKALGCAPSKNIHDKKATIRVDPNTYTTRSAAGHLHFGLPDWMRPNADRLVRICDIVIGNTCVIIDRDPLAAKRREVYGRCGEYRTPPHGMEYRTLSNFWLRSYPLASFVWGLQRLVTGIMSITLRDQKEGYTDAWYLHKAVPQWDAEGELLRLVDYEAVARAINTNDLDLAKANYKAIKPFIEKHVPELDCGLQYNLVEQFDHFIKRIDEEGIGYWFPDDPMSHWCGLENGHDRGWESFLEDRVSEDIRRSAWGY